MVVKFFSCVCAVASGLPVGPEGPMIHLGYLPIATVSILSSINSSIHQPFHQSILPPIHPSIHQAYSLPSIFTSVHLYISPSFRESFRLSIFPFINPSFRQSFLPFVNPSFLPSILPFVNPSFLPSILPSTTSPPTHHFINASVYSLLWRKFFWYKLFLSLPVVWLVLVSVSFARPRSMLTYRFFKGFEIQKIGMSKLYTQKSGPPGNRTRICFRSKLSSKRSVLRRQHWPFRALALSSIVVSLWRRANARNVRLYYPYWQYTDLV